MKKLAEHRFEDAVVAASVALSATARLEYPTDGDKAACRQFLEHNLPIICKIGWVAFGVSQPISFRYRRLDSKVPGISVKTMPEMLYDVLRCTAVHEAGLPSNLRFTELPLIQTGLDGELVLPIDVIYGLLIAIVGSPKNAGQQASGNPIFSFGGKSIRVNELWGERETIAEFIEQTISSQPTSRSRNLRSSLKSTPKAICGAVSRLWSRCSRSRCRLANRRDRTMRAYALMRHPEELESVFSSSPFYDQARIEIDAIRAGLPNVLPLSYRGIGRYPFTEYAERGPGWQWEGEAAQLADTEPQARALMLNFLGPWDYLTPSPRAFLGRLEHARSIYAALSAAWMYEIVELCAAPEYPRDLLGFDVGYWGGGNFSVLCDAGIWPLWHPPVPAVLSDLALALSELNEHGLFPTEASALAYFDWYARQPWAETEPSEFSIIAVGALNAVG